MPDDVENRPLQVLTVNIHRGRAAYSRRSMLPELRDAMHALDSDVVLLQEVQASHADAPAAAGVPAGMHQAEFLAEGNGSHVAFGRNARFAGSDLGNAVLSRWPILSHDNHDVSHAGVEARGLLHCVIDLPSVELHTVCVHLGLKQSHRNDQVERLCQLLAHRVPAEAPLIVGGDFNDWRSRADRLLRASGLHEVHRHAHGRHARSFPARWPLFMLDRIYVRRFSAHRPLPLPRRPWALLSDHLPLAAEVEL